jgi:hypothetical protein
MVQERDRIAFPFLERSHVRSTTEQAWTTIKSFLPCFVTVMPALFLLSLRQPRASRRILAQRPGVMACGAGSLVLGWEAVRAGYSLFHELARNGWHTALHRTYYRFIWWERLLPSISPIEIAIVILAMWFAIAFGQRWRPEKHWIDRAGRALGVSWIVCALIEVAAPWSFFEEY